MKDSDRKAFLDLDLAADQSLESLAEAAEEWGASFRREGLGGRLELPVSAGLRQGWLRIHVAAKALDSQKTHLELEVFEEVLALHRPAIMVLALAAAGAIVVSVWPFFPALVPMAPIAAVLAVVGWLMVGSQIRYRGLREFLDLVGEHPSPPSVD